jgi:sortase B
MSKRSVFILTAAAILAAVLLIACVQLWRHYSAEQEAGDQFDNLTEQVQTPAPTLPTASPEPDRPDEPPTEWTVVDQYGALFDANPDMIGWIKIDGTTIDYPVMHTPDRPDFYLKRGFDGKPSDYGVPYAAEGCAFDPQTDNVIVYGHHMKSGKMFGVLESYKDEAFWREHPVIRFDTKPGFGEYEVLAVFRTTPAKFPFHRFIAARDQAAFNEYVYLCKELAFYDTGVTAEYGDRLLTLSTCEYTEKDSRLVVVAVRRGGD